MPLYGLLVLVLIAVAPQERSATPESPDGPVVVVGEVTPRITSGQRRPLPPSKKRKKQKLEVKLVCSPRIALSSILGATLVSATLSVNHPGENFWCPKVEWYINTNSAGSHEGDCPPYETVLAEKGEPDRWSEDVPRYFKLWRGKHVIVAKLTKSGRVLAEVECGVDVW